MVKAQTLHRLLIVFILVGLAFSTYAAIETYLPAAQSACTVTGTPVSCGKVDQSPYSHEGPIPLWTVGVAGFLLLLLLDIPLYRTYELRYLQALIALAGVGVVVAVVLGAVEVFLIGAICPICLGAYLSGFAVLVVALRIYRLRHEDDLRAGKESQDPSPS